MQDAAPEEPQLEGESEQFARCEIRLNADVTEPVWEPRLYLSVVA